MEWKLKRLFFHGTQDCNVDFNRTKTQTETVFVFINCYLLFVNTLGVHWEHDFSHNCILTLEVCKIMKCIIFYYLILKFTKSFYCDSFTYEKTNLWHIHIHLLSYEIPKSSISRDYGLCLWEQIYKIFYRKNEEK